MYGLYTLGIVAKNDFCYNKQISQTHILSHFREHRLLRRAPEAQPAPKTPETDTAAQSIIESTRSAVDALDAQRKAAESQYGQERIARLQNVQNELDALHAQVEAGIAAPEKTADVRNRIAATRSAISNRIRELLTLEKNSVYTAGQTLLRSPLGGPLKGVGGMLTKVGMFLKDAFALLTPLWENITAPLKALGPKTTSLLATIIGSINPAWGDAVKHATAVEQQPAMQNDIDTLFRTFLAKGRLLEPADRATKQDLDTLRFIRDAAGKQGYTPPGFAQGVLKLVPGTGSVTYAQLAEAAKKLPLDARIPPSTTTPSTPQ